MWWDDKDIVSLFSYHRSDYVQTHLYDIDFMSSSKNGYAYVKSNWDDNVCIDYKNHFTLEY